MKIETIDIAFFHCDRGTVSGDVEGLSLSKSLPYLSIAQSITGCYDISLDNGETYHTNPMGAFIAPSKKTQHIRHIPPESGKMQIQWVFINAVFNKKYSLDDIYHFPVILPEEYEEKVFCLINRIIELNGEDLCLRYKCIYELVDILIKVGRERKTKNSCRIMLENYIEQHYSKKISIEEISEVFSISTPTVYRKFSEYFGISPKNYINNVRLMHAAVFLETSENTVGEICDMVGFSDAFYFSKLFKKKYGISPSEYRKTMEE